MGSAFFGYGMILGERYAYQADWPKIQARLENGEKIENIIQEYTGRFTAVVMKEAEIIFSNITTQFGEIMISALKNLALGEENSLIEHLLHGHIHFSGGDTKEPITETKDETIPCPSGFHWSSSAQQCVPDTTTTETTTTTTGAFIPPIVSLANINNEPTSKAIAQVRPFTDKSGSAYVVDVQQMTGKWVQVTGFLSTKLLGMTFAAKAYPSPRYYPSFRNNGKNVYYFRIQ